MTCYNCGIYGIDTSKTYCPKCESLPDIAVISETAAFLYGTSLYRLKDGKVVEITHKTKSPEAKEYTWRDKRILGEILQYEGMGRLGELTKWD